MKKLLLILVLAVLCGSIARAEHFDDIDDGIEAYLKEDYATPLNYCGRWLSKVMHLRNIALV